MHMRALSFSESYGAITEPAGNNPRAQTFCITQTLGGVSVTSITTIECDSVVIYDNYAECIFSKFATDMSN